MSQFKRQRINPLPGGRNFSGDHFFPYLASSWEVCAVELVWGFPGGEQFAADVPLENRRFPPWLPVKPCGGAGWSCSLWIYHILWLTLVLKVVGAVPVDCFSFPIGTASTSLLGPPPGLLTPPVATELSQNARHLQVGWASLVVSALGTGCMEVWSSSSLT